MVDCRWVLSCSAASLVLVPAFSHVQFCTFKHLIPSMPHFLSGSALISSFCFLQPWFLTWVCMQTTRSLNFRPPTSESPQGVCYKHCCLSSTHTSWIKYPERETQGSASSAISRVMLVCTRCRYSLIQTSRSQAWTVLSISGGIWQCLETFWVVTTGIPGI